MDPSYDRRAERRPHSAGHTADFVDWVRDREKPGTQMDSKAAHVRNWYAKVPHMDPSYHKRAERRPRSAGHTADFMDWVRDREKPSTHKDSKAASDSKQSTREFHKSAAHMPPMGRPCADRVVPMHCLCAAQTKQLSHASVAFPCPDRWGTHAPTMRCRGWEFRKRNPKRK